MRKIITGENFKRVGSNSNKSKLQGLIKAQGDIYDRFEAALRNNDSAKESELQQKLENIFWEIEKIKRRKQT